MKQISVIAIIILLVAAVAFFLRDKGARAELANAEKQVTALSNEVATVTTRMMMHAGATNQLTLQISNHLARIAGFSNRVAKAADDLKHLQEEHAATTADLQKQTKKTSDAEMRITQLDAELGTLRKTLDGRDSDLKRLRETLAKTEAERSEFQTRLQKAEADVVRLQLDQTDETALRAQLKHLDRQWPPLGFAKAPRTDEKGAKRLAAKANTIATGYYLQIQPDGTVKLLPSYEAAGATGAPK